MIDSTQQNEHFIHYQPTYDLHTHKIVAIEGLLRWKHPKLGRIATNKFIQIAEDIGQIHAIDLWTLQSAYDQFSQWHRAGLKDCQFSINLSGNTLYQKSFIEKLLTILDSAKLPPNHFNIEIDEPTLLHKSGSVIKPLKSLQKHSVNITLDHYGSSECSIKHLHELKVHTLKLDKKVIEKLSTNDPEPSKLLQSILSVANLSGIQVVAQGVETEKQYLKLKSLGCQYAQGYYFSKPVSASNLSKLLEIQ